MGLSSAVDWWEEWQLWILVLGSQSVQWLLFLSARRRKSIVSPSVRLLIWLAYIGSDAVAIYALAALFNRHKKQGNSSMAKDESILEVLWAPVLLMHLGGQDCITAYNMEDNELWKRHVLTAVSQITVSIYVFCKSWRGGDKKLLQAAIMLFTVGGIRCLEKPLALQKASINSLANSSDTTVETSGNTRSDTQIKSLEEYVEKVGALYQTAAEAQEGGDVVAKHPSDKSQVEDDVEANRLSDKVQVEDDVEANRHSDKARVEDDVEANRHSDKARVEDDVEANRLSERALVEGDVKANRLSDKSQVEGDVEANCPSDKAQVEDDVEVRHSSDTAGVEDNAATNRPSREVDSYDQRQKIKDQVNKLLVDLASPYSDRLAVTESFCKLDEETVYAQLQKGLSNTFDLLYTKSNVVFPPLRIGRHYKDALFYVVGRYLRFACIILPFAAIGLFHRSHREDYDDKDVKVTYTLLCCTAVMEFFSYTIGFGSEFSCMVAQYSFMGYFARDKRYTKRISILSSLNLKEYIDQQWSMKPINSSSIITTLVHQEVKGWWMHIGDAANYRKFNNHMGQWTIEQKGCSELIGRSVKRSFDESVLLWHIATDLCFYDMDVRSEHYASAEKCRVISNYMMYLLFAKPEMLMAGTRRNLLIVAYTQLNCMLGGREQPPVDERAVAQRLIAKLEESPEGGYLVHDACGLAKNLLGLNDEKMWEVIKGVWVEMLCYSASRCRGYLHAKSLGTGGELLTFVWLLWSHMGMETLAERMQMPGEELPSEEELPSCSSKMGVRCSTS